MTTPKTIQSKPLAPSLKYLGLMFFILELSILLLFLQGFGGNEQGADLVVVLFAIPPVLQLIGLLLLKDVLLESFYSLISFLSSGLYFVSLLYYMLQPKATSYSGWLCILASAGLVVLAFCLTSLTFRDSEGMLDPESGKVSMRAWLEKSSIMRRVAASIGTSPSGEILVFLAFFISIGYLLGFALAFHDRNLTTQGLLPGLIADSIPRREDVRHERPDMRRVLFFKEGSAKVEFEPRDIRDKPEPDPAMRNQSALEEIINELSGPERLPFRVTLIAHSDERMLSPRAQYRSNYELAEARANNVRATVLDLLSKRKIDVSRNIEWLVVPLPEPSSRDGNEDSANQRAVEVLVRLLPQEVGVSSRPQIRLLTLLEHIYFSMYTITTTGYGDIKPSTPYAMFVCTLENLYEVFFMVVFFNVLLSPKARARRRTIEDSNPVEKEATENAPLGKNPDSESTSAAAVLVQPKSADSESHSRMDASPSKKRENRKKRRR